MLLMLSLPPSTAKKPKYINLIHRDDDTFHRCAHLSWMDPVKQSIGYVQEKQNRDVICIGIWVVLAFSSSMYILSRSVYNYKKLSFHLNNKLWPLCTFWSISVAFYTTQQSFPCCVSDYKKSFAYAYVN